MTFFMGCLCIIISCVSAIPEIIDCLKTKKIKVLNIFFVVYGIIYGIIPLTIVLNLKTDALDFSFINTSDDGINDLTIFIFCALFCIFTLRLGIKTRFRIFKHKGLAFSPSNESKRQSLETQYHAVERTTIIAFIIGACFLTLWINSYGGFSKMLMISGDLRNGTISSSKMGFAKRFCGLLTFSSYASCYLFKKSYHPIFNRILFVVATVFATVYYLLNDGRLSAAVFFLTIALVLFEMFDNDKEIGKRLLILIIVVGLFSILLFNLRDFTYWVRYKTHLRNTKSLAQTFYRESGFTYYVGQCTVDYCRKNGSPFFIIYDIGKSLVAWIPSSIIKLDIPDLWKFSTENVIAYGITWGGEKPTGIVATSLYEMGVIGLIIIPFFWGRILTNSEKLKKEEKPFSMILYYWLMYSLIRIIMYCYIEDFVRSLFCVFLTWLIYKYSINTRAT